MRLLKLKIISVISILSLISYSFNFLLVGIVSAAGISIVATPSESAISTTANIQLVFTPTTPITNGSTMNITWTAGNYTGYASLVSADVTATGSNITSVSSTFPGDGSIVTTFTTSGNVTTAVTVTIGGTHKLTTPSTPNNYSFAIVTSVGDYGAVLQYVGDDNDVNISAIVTPVMAFSIRNSADTADTNACALGTLILTAVNTCAYRLKVTTNSNSGYTVTINSDGDLRRSGSGDVVDAQDIDPIAENSTVTSGTENYGIAFNGGASTTGSITESGNFNDDDTPIPISSPTTLYTSSGGNNPATTDTTNTALVTHRAAIDGGTQTGNYSHIVTYTATASF